jgi:ABC-type uncharacterized transport system ATPase subunit
MTPEQRLAGASRYGTSTAVGRPALSRPAPSSPGTLAVDGISVRLAGREVLHDVRFTIGAGEFTGLIGSNGAGKTTLLRVILGLQQPSAGTVRIDGAVHMDGTGRSRRGRRSAGYGCWKSGASQMRSRRYCLTLAMYCSAAAVCQRPENQRPTQPQTSPR